MGSSIGRKAFCSITVIAALAGSILVLASSKDRENISEVKFTARTELVLIPALVTDKSGKHLTGLQQEVPMVDSQSGKRTSEAPAPAPAQAIRRRVKTHLPVGPINTG